MAWMFDANGGSPGSGGAALFKLKELLKAAGWTVTSSSDGTTYFPATDGITTGGSGAGGLNNALAWFRIRQPSANTREFTFQRASASTHSWRVKYSGGPATTFVGGAPSATQTPSATDEQIIIGGGTDAAPTFTQIFDTPDAGWRFNAAADNESPWSFYYWTHINSGSAIRTFFMLDGMLSGTALSGDVDQAVIYEGALSASILQVTDLTSYSVGPRGWVKKTLAGSAFARIAAQAPQTFPNLSGTQPFNSKDQLYPVVYARESAQAAPTGHKGVSSVMRWLGTVRTTFDTFNVRTTKDYVTLSGTAASPDVVLPWNGSDVAL